MDAPETRVDDRVDDRERDPAKESTMAGVTNFVVMCVLFLVGLGLLSLGYSEENAFIFFGGIVVASLAFFIPMMRRD
ncbi:hypothetical protein [Cellulomonas sp. PhB143]|uniref:hypothetical protein n=1 Tax=Cellulomonas sp. PhB143 TaxID=2485186 RepID=UPI000F483637|nr:hypothetical protein [Cellulomonas sp. PhB143]ROS73326.1 hypothetical protein EDF32_2593 [Cellulomonas sp. PhB143]